MQFALTLTNSRVIYFDNILNLFSETPMPQESKVEFHAPIREKAKAIRRLDILLGFNCNFKCSYCSNPTHKKDFWSIKQSERIDLVRVLKRYGYTFQESPAISFWGGEPLLYFKEITSIVERFHEEYPEVAPRFSMTTNGFLLDAERIRFCLENNISIKVSHDGYSNRFRSIDILDNVEMVKTLRWGLEHFNKDLGPALDMNVVLTPENCDIEKQDAFFVKRFGACASYLLENVVMPIRKEVTQKTIAFSSEDFSRFQTSLINACVKERNARVWHFISPYFKPFLRRLQSERPNTCYACRCGIDRMDYLCVSLKGDVLNCHIQKPNEEIGVLGSDRIVPKVNPWWECEACSHCLHLPQCLGYCQRLTTEERLSGCLAQKTLHLALLNLFTTLNFGGTLVSVRRIRNKEAI